MTRTIRERFEEKFAKLDGCWEWKAFKSPYGYGKIWIAGRPQLAHRVAYQLYVGEIPEGLCVCHSCDNRKCVNPSHLFLGTNADNVRDREKKSRGVMPMRSGEKNSQAKLSEEQIVEIRTMRSEGIRGIDLAKEFGVTQATISSIVHRRNWAKV